MSSPPVAALLSFLYLNVLKVAASEEPLPPSWVKVEECKRKCDGIPKTCYLNLVIERYTVLGPACCDCKDGKLSDCSKPQCVTADGFHRPVIAANRQIPAPPIEVCQNDTVIVDVRNQLPDQTTSIHWHGIRQTYSQWADGVPFVTQCPILPGNTFRYAFIATDLGTYFYHSHTGTQKLDGLSGPLIVRGIKSNDLYYNLYDEDDDIVMIQDWTHIAGEHLIPGLHYEDFNQNPVTYLINGKAQYHEHSKNTTLPITEYVVKPNRRYRFRLIGSTCTTCPVSIQFEGHRVTAISSDGDLKFKPVTVDTVILNSADRFDIILEANQAPGIYFIKVEGHGSSDCNATQYAILRYEGFKTENTRKPYLTSNDMGTVFNDVISGCGSPLENGICMNMLKGVSNAPEIKNQENYFQIEIDIGFFFPSVDYLFEQNKYLSYDEPSKNVLAKALVNNVTFSFPPSPLLTQFADIPPSKFCKGECTNGPCSCVNYQSVPQNAIVDLIIVHKDNFAAHPVHLHGFNFYVLHLGTNSSDAAIADLKERLRTNQIDIKSRAMRDTVSAPVAGVAAVRFIADNIGYWLYHCHYAYHLESGMAGVIKVGEVENLPIPDQFPKCGDFIPNIEDSFSNFHNK